MAVYRICHLTMREARELEQRGIVPDCASHDHVHSDKAQLMVSKPYRNLRGLWMEARYVGMSIVEAMRRFGPEKAREVSTWLNYRCIVDIPAKTWRSMPSGTRVETGTPRACVMQMVRGAGQGPRYKPMFPKSDDYSASLGYQSA